MPESASDLARRLARSAEAVCRHYLPNGRREGRYWLVGDVAGTPGRSLFVRLTGPESGKGAAGKWTDAATGEHGDLLDLIAANRRLSSFRDVLEEVRSFLRLPRPEPVRHPHSSAVPTGSREAARRLWAVSQPIHGTIADKYLRHRGITDVPDGDCLRFHPRCYYRGDESDPTRESWPALIAAVRDGAGKLTGVHRTWLALDGSWKAPITTPRRAMGNLLGHGVRFGEATDVMAAGEGIETMLSLRQVALALPVVAGLSANHLAALELPPTLRLLYLVRDDDPAGRGAVDKLAARAVETGIEVLVLDAELGDLNDDLRLLGRNAFKAAIRAQLAPEDVARFLVTSSDDRRLA